MGCYKTLEKLDNKYKNLIARLAAINNPTKGTL